MDDARVCDSGDVSKDSEEEKNNDGGNDGPSDNFDSGDKENNRGNGGLSGSGAIEGEEKNVGERDGLTRAADAGLLGEEYTVSSLCDLEPFIGKEFDGLEEAYDFYNTYAKEMGFGIRNYRTERSRVDNRILCKLFVCANQGFKCENDKRRKGKIYVPRATRKTDCKACMRVKLRNEKWVVDRWVSEHNHELLSPTEVYKLRSHKKMTKATMVLMGKLQHAGFTHTQVTRILRELARGERNIGVSDDACENQTRTPEKKLLGVDCTIALDYFELLQETDPGYFYTIQVGKDNKLKGIFWADKRSREQYQLFGDVVVLDTAFMKDRYNFPFASFTGFNHHKQSILFGCGLIADESEESYIWLFKTWLRAMNGKHPIGILTDQDKGMLPAIAKVFPFTRHRLCNCCTTKIAKENLTKLWSRHDAFEAEYRSCVDSHSSTEFEYKWRALIQKYRLQQNIWLNEMYTIRHMWVACYFIDTFFAGITTIQKNVGLNRYFKGFFSHSTPLTEFVTQYEGAIKWRRVKESKQDIASSATKPRLSTGHPIEKQAAAHYTNKMFIEFSDQWFSCFGCEAIEDGFDGPALKFKVGIHGALENEIETVSYDKDSGNSKCSCRRFEQIGILCKHVLRVYVKMDRTDIPQNYMLMRWSNSSRHAGALHNDTGLESGSSQTQMQTVWVLQDAANKVARLGSESEAKFIHAMELMESGVKSLSEMEGASKGKSLSAGNLTTLQFKQIMK
ncbi:protein FAR1-RELATED SEQUENCE 5-like [Macadamia integrifolia]|uniref:protein FAR1-RELATED SEQUENCE 5-like n=1 Tax=Macadamia integrifolia TaxID=60698 RepID=UPI001C528BD7|nr:protein FAR1-RELATED SEQUENCE 5-like [Macadamia integrifolia]XP_042479092.1 protein FAR1-RELATED SEQUENCE 5-like [Macadamia integrifolia]